MSVRVSSSALGLLLLRLSLGLMYLAHAGLKLFVFTLPGTAPFFASQGLPPALAYLVFVAEAVGGVLLLLGVYPRQAALALMPVLLGAAWEYPVFLAAMSAVLWLSGDGALAQARAVLRQRFVQVEAALGAARAAADGGPWFAGACFGLVDAVFEPVFRYFEVHPARRPVRRPAACAGLARGLPP